MLDAYVRDSGGVVEADLQLRMSDFWGDATFTPDDLGELNNELQRVLAVATGEDWRSSWRHFWATASSGAPRVVVPD